jgi:hypothetical protein
MPSPRVLYNDDNLVDVELPFAALGNDVSHKMQDGESYPFSGGMQCSLEASGVLGLDTGSRANNTWYHLYLVVDSGVLKPVWSANDPGTGPVGVGTNFLPIHMSFNGNTGVIAPFDYEGAWCHFRTLNAMPAIMEKSSWSPADNQWDPIDLSDSSGWLLDNGIDPTNFPGIDMSVVDVVEVTGNFDEDADIGLVFLRGGDGTPTEVPGYEAVVYARNGHAFALVAGADSTHSTFRIPVPDGNVYYQFREESNSIDIGLRVRAFRHKYRF